MDGGESSDLLLEVGSWSVLLGVAGGSILAFASCWLVGIVGEGESLLDSELGPGEFGSLALAG